MIVNSRLKTINEESEKEKFLNELKEYVKHSYFLLDKIKQKSVKYYEFCTSKFVLSEVYTVIGYEYRSKILQEKGVPLRYWSIMIRDVHV